MSPPKLLLVWSLFVCAGCSVPKGAGFDDVKKLLADRGVPRVHWNQGTDEDQRVADRVRALLAKDLTVASASEIALLNNPRLQATYERLGVAQADVVQAGLLKNPILGAHIGFPLGTSILELEGSIVGEFLDLFLIPLKKRLARAEFQRVKLEVADAVLDLADRVRVAWFTAQAAAQAVELRQTVLAAAQAAAELALRQHEAGNLSDLDLTSQQRMYTMAKLDLARAQTQQLVDREELTRLLGVWGASAAFTISGRLPELPAAEPALEQVESFAIAHRLDLAAAREAVNNIDAALRITKTTRFIGGLGAGLAAHQDPDGPRAIGPSVQIELPIFDQKQAEVARLKAQLRAAERRVTALAVDIRSEVRTARTRIQSTRAIVAYFRATLMPQNERFVALTQQQYSAMLLGVYQLLQAKREEVDAYGQYIESVRDCWIAYSNLERAAGGAIASSAPAAREGAK